MTRNRASAKTAGTKFERAIADYLNKTISGALMLGDIWIDRRVKTGSKDRGDIGGVRRCEGLRPAETQRVVIECKDTATLRLPEWTREAEIERGNDDALVGVVVHKRRGTANPAEQWVSMTVADLVALLTGERLGESQED